MNSKEAKDFLIEQTSQQAAIQGIALSDLEKRMMYFTEWDDSGGNPIELNEEFESQYDTPHYERKIAGLMRNAYKRIKNEKLNTQRLWDEAIRTLGEGDHYILVLWGASNSRKRSPHDHVKLLLAGILLATFMMFALWLVNREVKSPVLSRVVLYPLVILVSGFLVKYLGRSKNSKT
jgi:hypothetical protein